ncbi:MAG: hypothetical protein KC444_06195, partial [Nitrosopumilus sp.]|nr:hypothetical protein [Nitrosopumilus sp.]
MVKSEILYGVLASLIAGLVILNIPIISEDYWTQPKFKAQVNNIETSDGNFTQIKIFNEGASQAKEGFAAIDKKKNLILNYTTCHEGNIVSDNEEQTKINFERLSTGINCHVFYNEHNKFNIDRIIVSAEDS